MTMTFGNNTNMW